MLHDVPRWWSSGTGVGGILWLCTTTTTSCALQSRSIFFSLANRQERYGRLRFNVAIHVASPVIKIIQLVIFSFSSLFFSFSLPLSCFLFDFSETRKWTSIWRISAGPAEMPYNMYKRGRTITDVPTRPSLCFLLSFVFLLLLRERERETKMLVCFNFKAPATFSRDLSSRRVQDEHKPSTSWSAFEQLAVNRFLLFILFRPVSSRDGKFIITISIQQWENNQPSLNDDVPEKLDVYVLVGHYFTKGKLGNWSFFFLKISFINCATIYDGNDGRKCPVIPLSLLLFVSYVCLITTRVGNSPWFFSSRCCTGILVFPFHFLWYLS